MRECVRRARILRKPWRVLKPVSVSASRLVAGLPSRRAARLALRTPAPAGRLSLEARMAETLMVVVMVAIGAALLYLGAKL
jgi:hypothetical protein